MNDDIRLQVLSKFTPAGLTPGYGQSYLFFVGRDDVHGILHYLITNETLALKFNQFGYDDDELNQDILTLMANPGIRGSGNPRQVSSFGRSRKGDLGSR